MGLWNWLFGGRANELATPTSPLEPPAPAGSAWQSSENGNPTTIIGRIRLTVFPQDNGWKFCIANVDDRGEPHFSDVYASEAAAREEALAAVQGEPSRHRPLWVDGAENRRRRMEAELDASAATIEDLRAWLSGNPDAGISALRKPESKIRSQLRQLDWHVGELERLGASASVITGAREQSRILSDLAGEVAARLAAKQAQRKPRTAPAVQSLLPPVLAARVDQVIALLADTPPLAEADRAERYRRAHAAAFERMLTEGTSYNQAAGGPEFFDQDEASFRAFIRKTDQDLAWHCDTVASAFRRHLEQGEVVPPHYPMRIAILLRKAKDLERERRFLAAWCGHFPHGNGKVYGDLLERARSAGAIVG